MSQDQAYSNDITDNTSMQKASDDSQSDLSRSVWSDMKDTQVSQNFGPRAESEIKNDVLDFGVADIYGARPGDTAGVDLASEVTNSQVVEVAVHKDGTVVTKGDDGTITGEGSDGTKVTQKPDGTETIEKGDMKWTTEPDGTKTFEIADRYRRTQYPDGMTVTEQPGGYRTTEFADGVKVQETPFSKTTEYPSGMKIQESDGKTEIELPDGTKIVDDGKERTVQPAIKKE